MKLVNKKRVEDLVAKGALLVDMRSPVDFRDGSITGSVNLPLKNFTNRLMGLAKTQKIVIISKTVDDADVKVADNYANQLGLPELFVAEYSQLVEAAQS